MNSVLYARYSPRPDSATSESIECQLERMRQWCGAVGATILSEYCDADLSGSRADNRPGLQAAIRDACENHAVLVVYSLSRLARNTRDAMDIADQLSRSHADLASLQERLDTTSPMGRFFFVVMSALAALERETIVTRTRDAMRRHQNQSHRRMGRTDRCPYGWQPDGEKGLKEVPSEQRVLAIMLEHADKRAGYIARVLDGAGYRRRNGKHWSSCTHLVSSILRRLKQDS